jgi:hypothetical protein
MMIPEAFKFVVESVVWSPGIRGARRWWRRLFRRRAKH